MASQATLLSGETREAEADARQVSAFGGPLSDAASEPRRPVETPPGGGDVSWKTPSGTFSDVASGESGITPS